MKPRSPWLLHTPSANAALRLFCLPYAGGSATAFIPWQAALAPDIELCPIQLPGRGGRMMEPPQHDLEHLLDALTEVMRDHAHAPYALFGHSMGGLIAFELAHRCRREGLPLPTHLIVSASSAPASRKLPRRLHELDDDALIEALRAYNGTPPEALAHRELMELLLPAIRADFALLAGYRYRERQALPVPLTVLAGTKDAHVPPTSLLQWAECSTYPCTTHWLDGDHFFLHAQRTAVLGYVRSALALAAASPTP